MNKPPEEMKATKFEPYLLGVEAYISEDYLRAERDKLWPKVWLQAGRVEEIPEVGNYITYDILDDSFLITRSEPDKIQAFYNVCMHRGRRLVDTPCEQRNACGKAKQLRCGFHGWRWNMSGENVHVLDKEDWDGALTPENLRLRDVKVDTWGGWIWISMDPDIEPVREWLSPIPDLLDPFHLENMRFKWRRWGIFPCNWKVALEAFNEAYHVSHTHPEFMAFGEFSSMNLPHGLHSQMVYSSRGTEEQKGKLRLGSGKDPRISTAEMVAYTMKHVDTNYTQTLKLAADRLVDELEEGTPPDQVLKHWLASAKRDDAARGVFWPEVSPEDIGKSGNTWQIFPNFQIGHALNNALCYSARPYGSDPDKCIFEAVTYELYPAGEEPKADWIFMDVDDPRWGPVLAQDFDNMAAVQQGMKTRGFPGPRPNPVQENAINTLHRNLAKYIGRSEPKLLR